MRIPHDQITFGAVYTWQEFLQGIQKLVKNYFYCFTDRDPVGLQILISDRKKSTAALNDARLIIDTTIKQDFFFLKSLPEVAEISFGNPSALANCAAFIKTGSLAETGSIPGLNLPMVELDGFKLLGFAYSVIPHDDQALIEKRDNTQDHTLSKDKQQTSDLWADQYLRKKKKDVLDFPPYKERWNERISGSADKDHYQFFADFTNKLPEREAFLSVGCGVGVNEFGLLRHTSPPIRFDAFDLSRECIEAASFQAQQEGISCLNYRVEDIHYLNLPKRRYDMVMAFSSLHHFYNLERIFWEISRSLKKEGQFLVYEYCGPTRMQFGPIQEKWIDEFVKLVPGELRRLNDNPQVFKTGYFTPSLENMIKLDYSEGIRSAEIAPLIRKYFNILEERPAGGSILGYALNGVENNFDIANPTHMELVGKLTQLEDRLLEKGEVEHDFRGFVGIKKHQQ